MFYILTKRILPKYNHILSDYGLNYYFIDSNAYIQELHVSVTKFPGFIKANTYWNTDLNCLYTISKWNL